MQRICALLLVMLLMSSSVFASSSNPQNDKDAFGDDWKKVAALQPGDSYISGDKAYFCSEKTYVNWTRVKSSADLNPSDWGGNERLLLMTDKTGKKLFVGNDYGYWLGDDGVSVMIPQSPSATRKVVSGVTQDTSGNNQAKYADEFIYPELNEFVKNSKSGYPYPDTFKTLGTMNAPYIRDAGIDYVNGNHRKFKIILAKDDGSMSGVALGHDEDCEYIRLTSVGQSSAFTFHMNGGKLRIFDYIEGEADLQLYFESISLEDVTIDLLGGVPYNHKNFNTMPDSGLVLYVGEKTVERYIETISLSVEDAEQNPEALENVYGGAIQFYRWEKITSGSQLPTGNDTYRALLVWNDQYFLQGDDFRYNPNFESMALHVNEEKTGGAVQGNVKECQQINLSKSNFYTMGGLGTPYLKFTHKDTNKNNDRCPYYTFQLAGVDDQPSGKWLCDGDNILDLCLGKAGASRYGGMEIGIVVGQEGDSDNDAAPGKVKMFFNEGGGGLDTGLMYSGNTLYGAAEGWDLGQFTLYIGKPVTYPAVRQNYVVGEDQFMHISQNGAMLKNVVITVLEGGVLSIESWFMNNGRIVVDGGTLIVQVASNPLGNEEADDTEDSVMMPFADIHLLLSGSLELKNGGELIIMDGARAAFSNIKATAGSSILNCGILLAESIDLHSSTLDNRKNAAVLAGYDFREMSEFRVNDLITDGGTARFSRMVSRLQANVGCITRRMQSSVHNDGWITYSTMRMSVRDDSVKESGSGSSAKLQGEKSRYMLSN